MTEYDYSPDAYEKYLARQQRIADWVDSTNSQAHRYKNPFVHAPSSIAPSTSSDSSHFSRRPSSRHDRDLRRSKTLSPTRSATRALSPSSPRSSHSHASPTSSHQSHAGYVYSPPATYTYPAASHATAQHVVYSPQAQFAYSSSPPGQYYTTFQPSSSHAPPGSTSYSSTNPNVRYVTYDASARRVEIPAPRPGQTYIVYPPPGGRVEVMSSSSRTSSSPTSPISPTSSSRLTKKKDQPIIGFFKNRISRDPSKGRRT
ncbi:hypothetical protein PUNSTDRAFT_120611 [Punctularia strigosozonata HHB-11173 SS5]|uniref:uncharacterized protein n=1 Tax=Punctularia strigosozonata (strain HHB-11173) TaxID=741275 RepID=UPI0004416CCF|nr:uncharacterized protein PUNSTDRAFT_120611 [Punctularia strigosozonata HHB-11173 SS5]EIN08133.1 hypothetical protein PUNSTDRAFT_120611 [Punctularia strigosozonata HHB-11173 SS5]